MRTQTKAVKQFYIGRRDNPQLRKPYFVGFGQLNKTEVKNKENSLYGSMSLTPYNTIEEYNQELAELKTEGYTVNIR